MSSGNPKSYDFLNPLVVLRSLDFFTAISYNTSISFGGCLMRCLVTGVAGFIGSHLAERLLADGHEVVGIDAFIDYYPRSIKEKNLEKIRSRSEFTFIEGNLLELSLAPLLDGIDFIFHQAAQAGVRTSWGRNFALYVDCNILATQRLLDALLTTGQQVKRFIYASSSSVYGNTKVWPISEATIPQPISPYGVTKLAGEHLCQLYYHNFGIPTVALRYFTVYGPGQRPDMAFHRFCKAIINHEPIHIFGDGAQTRDFTYVADVVEANIRAATFETQGTVMNIAGGSRVTVREVMALLEEISSTKIQVIFEQEQHGDVRDTFADTSIAQQLIGYRPLTSLREGLQHEFHALASFVQR
jgi:nucleoside-diphosphate-sugar epimerase